jgi:hypothetical protein
MYIDAKGMGFEYVVRRSLKEKAKFGEYLYTCINLLILSIIWAIHICICKYIHIYIYIYMYIHVFLHLRNGIWICWIRNTKKAWNIPSYTIYVFINIFIYLDVHKYVDVCRYSYLYVYKDVCKYLHIHIYIGIWFEHVG